MGVEIDARIRQVNTFAEAGERDRIDIMPESTQPLGDVSPCPASQTRARNQHQWTGTHRLTAFQTSTVPTRQRRRMGRIASWRSIRGTRLASVVRTETACRPRPPHERIGHPRASDSTSPLATVLGSCQPIPMSDDDSFENRLREIADQIVRSLSDNDIDEVAQRFGVDADRARGIAGDIERWLGGRLFDQAPRTGNHPNFRDTEQQTPSTTAFGAGPTRSTFPLRNKELHLVPSTRDASLCAPVAACSLLPGLIRTCPSVEQLISQTNSAPAIG